MSIRKPVLLAALGFASAFAWNLQAADSEWHFKVRNKTSEWITMLEVSQDKRSWGEFDIGDGIEPGDTVQLVWDASTDDESCKQWIRAKFSDGEYSEPSRQDFCQDLEDPIEFSE